MYLLASARSRADVRKMVPEIRSLVDRARRNPRHLTEQSILGISVRDPH